jgi:hypothetical protein
MQEAKETKTTIRNIKGFKSVSMQIKRATSTKIIDNIIAHLSFFLVLNKNFNLSVLLMFTQKFFLQNMHLKLLPI